MQRVILVLIVLIAACGSDVTASEHVNGAAQALEIHVENVRGSEGNLVVAVYSDEHAFTTNGEPLAWASVPATVKTIMLSDLPQHKMPQGKVAIAVFHDSNRNGQYDMRGDTPPEGWGNSGDISQWSEPTYQDALTPVGVVTVKMHYYN